MRRRKVTAEIAEEYNIPELDPDSIHPNPQNYLDKEQKGSRLLVVAPPSGGKSTLIKSLMYAKQDVIPFAHIQSGTEAENSFYKKFCPDITIFEELNIEAAENFVKRQKIASKYLDNPWGYIILDDVFEEPALLNKPVFHKLLKNGRHYKLNMIIGAQYGMDLKSSIRSCFDGIFILREPVLANRERLYKNFAAGIPTFELFNKLMDDLTEDHTAMYINRGYNSSNKLEDIVKYYKAPIIDDGWTFGSQYAWDYHNARFDPKWDKDADD